MQPKVSDTDSDATHTTYRHVYDRHVCILSKQLVGCNTPFLWGQILWDANFFLTENERHTGETSEKYLVACGVHLICNQKTHRLLWEVCYRSTHPLSSQKVEQTDGQTDVQTDGRRRWWQYPRGPKGPRVKMTLANVSAVIKLARACPNKKTIWYEW